MTENCVNSHKRET